MKKRNINGLLCALLLAIAAAMILPATYTSPDNAKGDPTADEFFISGGENYIEYPNEGQSSACAAAYVLRHFGERITGDELSGELGRSLGAVTPHDIEKALCNRGYDAKAYHGSPVSLKNRVAEGAPVIVCFRAAEGMRYAAVTGYDDEYLYFVDPAPENKDAETGTYNRRIGTEEFIQCWKSDFPISDKVYITVKKR